MNIGRDLWRKPSFLFKKLFGMPGMLFFYQEKIETKFHFPAKIVSETKAVDQTLSLNSLINLRIPAMFVPNTHNAIVLGEQICSRDSLQKRF